MTDTSEFHAIANNTVDGVRVPFQYGRVWVPETNMNQKTSHTSSLMLLRPLNFLMIPHTSSALMNLSMVGSKVFKCLYAH